MKKTLPILALLLTSCTSDVGRYQHARIENSVSKYLVDTETGAMYVMKSSPAAWTLWIPAVGQEK